MKLKQFIMLAFMFLFLGANQIALAEITPKPAACPSVSAIKSVGLTYSKKADSGTYVVFQKSKYDTPQMWGFLVDKVAAASEKEALDNASTALPSLSGTPAPIYDKGHDIWYCVYSIGSGYIAMAFTLPEQANFNMGQMVTP